MPTKPNKKKLSLDDLKVDSFTTDLSSEDLQEVEATGGGTYGPPCYATRSYNCYSICDDKKDT